MEFWLFLPQMRMRLDQLVDKARAAEAAGFGGIALMDHLEPPMASGHTMFEAMFTATWLAAHTTTLRIGHLVLCDALREPAVLAQQAVALDHASGGRFELGIGAGSVPAELDVYGITPTSAGDRVTRLGETLDVLRGLWSGQPFDYDGTFHHLHGAHQEPVPTAPIPIVIGAAGPRMMRLVAEHATWWNLPVHQIDLLEARRPLAGGARVSIQQMVTYVADEPSRADVLATAEARFGPPAWNRVVGNGPELVDQFRRLRDRGVERVYTWFTDFASPDTLAGFGSEVVAPLA